MAWMANAHWPGRSQTRASRHMDSPRAVAPTRKSTASLQAGGTLCRMRRGAPCAAAPVAKVCTRTRARPVCFTGCPLFRANHFGPSPLPIGQGAWQGRGSLITVNIGDRVRPPPPSPSPRPAPSRRGGLRRRCASWRCQIASTFCARSPLRPGPLAKRSPTRRVRANTPCDTYSVRGWETPRWTGDPARAPPVRTRHWGGGTTAALSPQSRDTCGHRGPPPRRTAPPLPSRFATHLPATPPFRRGGGGSGWGARRLAWPTHASSRPPRYPGGYAG